MNCLDNLDKCKANCCKTVGFNISDNPTNVTNIMNYFTMTANRKRYHELHGFKVKRRKDRSWDIIIPENIFKKAIIEVDAKHGQLLRVYAQCSALNSENKCNLHGTNKKPYECSDLNQETAHKYYLTEGCIYNEK